MDVGTLLLAGSGHPGQNAWAGCFHFGTITSDTTKWLLHRIFRRIGYLPVRPLVCVIPAVQADGIALLPFKL